MFVSSYSTYIDTSKKIQNGKTTPKKESAEFFHTQQNFLQNNSTSFVEKGIQLNYISDYKALYNKQQLEKQENTFKEDKTKFAKLSTQENAKIAYAENSTMFSLMPKPKTSFTNTTDTSFNSALQSSMINIYIANDNYYRITAA